MSDAPCYYLSPRGDDSWSGRLAEPAADGSDGPWATLAHARDAVRTVRRDRPIRVELRGGRYTLAETLVFTAPDSGTDAAPVTYAGVAGERAVISGGIELCGWQAGQVNGRDSWQLDLPDVAAGHWSFAQLFVKGERRPRARFPKHGYHRFKQDPDGPRAYEWYQGVDHAYYRPGELDHWHNLGDVEIVALKHWYEQHLRIKTLDPDKGTVNFRCRTLTDLYDECGEPARYTVTNVFEALTDPGEWYLDRSAGRLYYMPMAGESLGSVEIIAPRLETLIRLAGTLSKPVRNLKFENLHFQHAQWQLPPENPGAVQAAFIVPGAIQLRAARDCVFSGCRVSHLAQYGIEVQFGSTRNRIVACEFSDLGAGAVKINHERGLEDRATGIQAFAGLDPVALGWTLGDEPEQVVPPACTEVADCHMHHNGRIFHSAVGVWIGDSGFNHVHHNSIHDQDYSGISCGWNWNYAANRTIGNRIEYNHVYNIGRGVLSDMGAIYLLGSQPGGVVRGNHVHDVSCNGYGGSGIYPDQGNSYLVIEDNIVHHTQSDCLSIHYGVGLTIRNNIFALADGSLIGRGREESVFVGCFEGNIVIGATPKMLGYHWENPLTCHFERNLYWSVGGAGIDFAGRSFADWQAQAQDLDGRVADPLFVAPQDGVFELAAESPAHALGFKPLNPAAAGPRDADAHRAANPVAPRAILEPRLELGEPTFPMAADTERLGTMPVSVFVPAGEPKLLSLTLTNHGSVTASGTVVFNVVPAGAASLSGALSARYALPPGTVKVFRTRVTLSAAADDVRVAARDADAAFPMVGQCLRRQRDLRIGRVAPVKDLQEQASVLAESPSRELRVRGRVAGTVRLVFSGDALLLQVDVIERVLRVNPEMPWTGSSVEVFCESPDSPLKVQQFLLFPGYDVHAAGARRTNHHSARVEAAPEIDVSSVRQAQGYQLTARFPLPVLFLKSDVDSFPFEVAVNTTLDEKCGPVGAKLFGGTFSWMGMDGWGTVHIAPDLSIDSAPSSPADIAPTPAEEP